MVPPESNQWKNNRSRVRADPGDVRPAAGPGACRSSARRVLAVVAEPGDRDVAGRLVERDRLGLAQSRSRAPSPRPRPRARSPRGGRASRRARPRPRAGGRDVHPLDLGGLRGADHLDVVAPAPGTGDHGDVVEVADEEGARRARRSTSGRAGSRRDRRSGRRTPPGPPRPGSSGVGMGDRDSLDPPSGRGRHG